ncbi:MAG: GGDEF domain-containing protein [Pseudolabrys sp.]|nr:GGDEF domain-containing protein [Pseudolabrys sp.]
MASEQRNRKDSPAADPADMAAEIERLKGELLDAEWKIAELEARADVDPLLDIFNRRGFERELARSLSYITRYGAEAALLYIDLDGFKSVNDRHGHAAGDALLKAVVAQIKAHVRASDVVARLGGDEFAVLMWNVGEAQAASKTRDLERAVASACVMWDGARIAVEASAGAVSLAPDAAAAAIIDAADRAMYVRKKERRG